ncbi:hypothetical protein QYE76_002438 [Lolium multiflorum]|uniref:Transposase (putative) gypsy type domain-containing protein n=1 Tax=Lolium multiflorum TaxID=4521 RepID=A0AAD8RLN1_LOLMU|nr:hypothetical protein QYE76_002438 [Lolium multiflorum]
MAAQDLGASEWERSKISAQDVNVLKKLGLMKKKDALIFPSEESYPSPPMEYRVSFVNHLIHGLSAPIHDFLRGLLFVYGLQLHQLTPNSILHVSIFITLCECFLGTQPNWAMWKRIFNLRHNGSHNIAYNIGGVVICVRPDVEYFDVKFPDSVQGWRKRCLMKPFINLGTQFIGYRNTVNGLKEALVMANKRADDLAVKLEKSEEARKKAEKDATSIEDLRKRLHEAETALSDKITQQIAREENVIARLESLNRCFIRKMSQDFELQKPEDDRLLDALSLLEIHADLVRRSIFDAQAAFSRLFPYFFPKKEQPGTFAALTKCFVPEEDLGLALRQENLKIGVEDTIALVAESKQNVDWAKVGATTRLKTEAWQALIRAAKPHSKKILSFLGKPAPSSSSAKPEICHSKLEMTKVVETVHTKLKRRRRGVDKIDEIVTPVAKEMIDDLLRMDADFFADVRYADFMGASAEEDRVNIDDLIGRD